jgi:hypothetical protein
MMRVPVSLLLPGWWQKEIKRDLHVLDIMAWWHLLIMESGDRRTGSVNLILLLQKYCEIK